MARRSKWQTMQGYENQKPYLYLKCDGYLSERDLLALSSLLIQELNHRRVTREQKRRAQ